MSYASAIEQLNAMAPELHTQPGQPRRKFSLAEIGTLLESLANPHRRFRAVLIAGTNGKGSTAATLASVLQASGLRTGLYTSPHLVRPNERIRVDGAEIADADFARLYFRVMDCAQKLVLAGSKGESLALAQLPSYFETLTAMAFLHFAEREVDVAVLEVGMGGRLDATNIVDPLLSIVTDISLDHTEWLGSTIGAIAHEKAGILRHGGALVTLPQHPEANQALGEVATELNVRGVSAVPYMPALSAHQQTGRLDAYTVEVQGAAVEVASPLHGAHQHRNIALAIAAAVELAEHHAFPITPASIAAGIRATRWPGRLETMATSAGRQWVVDVAHNPAGAWALRSALRTEFGLGDPDAPPATLVFSCLRDKPLTELARILFPVFQQVIFAPIHSPRATSLSDLMAAAEATGTPAVAAASVEEALVLAAKATGLVVISGSVYLVGEARGLLIPSPVNSAQ
ncbi:MAG TPA: folylpolyglutamate synthase/dihydrofolate synthase family protein [Terracidiphilus sp.]